MIAVVVALSPISIAAAHSDVVSIDPDGETIIDSPVHEISIVFARRAEPVGPGFLLVEPNGVIREPTSIRTDDGQTWILGFDPPLVHDIGLRWSLKSQDSHVINGSVDLDIRIEEDATSETVTAMPPSESALAVATGAESDSGHSGLVASGEESDQLTSAPVGEDGSVSATVQEAQDAPGAAVEEALVDTIEPALSIAPETVAYLGRLASMAGVMLAIGSLVFLVHLLRGTSGEARFLLLLIRRACLLIVAGVVAEVAAQAAAEAGRWSGVLSIPAGDWLLDSQFGPAAALRLLGAFGLATGCQFIREPVGRSHGGIALTRNRSLSLLAAAPRGRAVTNHPPLDDADQVAPSSAPMLFRWRLSATSTGAVLGVVAILGASAVDGHTLYSPAPVLSALSSATHVLAGSIWVGGVFVLLNLLYRRFRADRRAEAVDLAVRYSVVAALSLVLVGLAGLALTALTIGSPAELWQTDWGRLVLAKLMLVTVAGLFGAVNHFLLVPRLAVHSRSIELGLRLRQVITVELALLGLVLVLSAQLVSTAS